MPKTAIITRTKDRPLLLPRAIASVLAQSAQDWVHVIVNDGGDKTIVDNLIAQNAAQYNGRAHVIHLDQSRGADALFNVGIKAVDSEYIVILDDDDSWHPDFLTRTTGELDKTSWPDVGGVVTQYIRVIEEIKGDQIKIHRKEHMNKDLQVIEALKLFTEPFFPPASFLFRRALYDRVGGFDDQFQSTGDWDFTLRAVLESDIRVIPETLAHYHQRPQAKSSYGNTVIATLGHNRVQKAMVINKHIRNSYKAGLMDVGLLLAIAQQNEGLSRLGRAINKFLDRTVGTVRKIKFLSFLH